MHFAKEVGQLVQFVRDCPRVDSDREIQLPGDPERRTLKERQERGIPLDAGNWQELVNVAERLHVALPPRHALLDNAASN
jgi:uncharacterized oxidoreductase